MAETNPIQLLRGNIVDHDMKECELGDADTIGLYFSAHWCPPCRNFTPTFADCYKKWKAEGKSIEVVFISSDRGEDEFKGYLQTMPWKALNFAAGEVKKQLSSMYGISGIPTLVVVDKHGKLINKNARTKVAESGSLV